MQAQILCSHCSVDGGLYRGLRSLQVRQPQVTQPGRTLYGSSRAFQQRISAQRNDLPPLSWPSPPPHALGVLTAEVDIGTQRAAIPIHASNRRRIVCQTARMVPAISSASGDETNQTAEVQSSPLQGTKASIFLHGVAASPASMPFVGRECLNTRQHVCTMQRTTEHSK